MILLNGLEMLLKTGESKEFPKVKTLLGSTVWMATEETASKTLVLSHCRTFEKLEWGATFVAGQNEEKEFDLFLKSKSNGV